MDTIVIKDRILQSSKKSSTLFKNEVEKPFVQIMLELLQRKDGSDTMMIDATTQQVLSNDEFLRNSLQAANILMRRGWGRTKGEVIHIVLPNCIFYHSLVFAIWLLGGVPSLADPSLRLPILKKQVEDNQAVLIICQESLVDSMTSVISSKTKIMAIESIFCSPSSTTRMESLDYFLKGLQNAMNDTMVIFWSSGTTGKPKGIAHTRRFLQMSLAESQFPRPSTILQTTCFYHTGGFFLALDGAIFNSFKIVFLNANNSITAEMLQESIHNHKAAILICGSHHAVQLARSNPMPQFDLNSLKIVGPMGAAVHSQITKELKLVFPSMMEAILGYYGMTEVGTISTSMTPTSLGSLAPGVQVKIVDDNNALLKTFETGEIMAKTPTLMNGYLNCPEDNERFFNDPHNEGFVRTGDLGYYDAEGVLYYQGRIKELIKYQNCHISPKEIEEVALTHSGVADVGIYGRPDPIVQELVCAVVVKSPAGAKLTEDQVANYINERVDSFKQLRGGVKFVESLENFRNPQGKLIRAKLQSL